MAEQSRADGGRGSASMNTCRSGCGVLWKTGAGSLGGRWRKRQCNLVIESDTLKPTLLYAEVGGGRLRGAIILHRCTSVDAISISESESGLHKVAGSAFTIKADDRVYRLCSETAEESERWVSLLRDAIREYLEGDHRPAGRADAAEPEGTQAPTAIGDRNAAASGGDGAMAGNPQPSSGTMDERLNHLERKLTILMLEQQEVDKEAGACQASDENENDDKGPREGAGAHPSSGRDHFSSFDEASQTEAMMTLLRERDEARQQVARSLRENADLKTRCDLLKACVMEAEDSRDELAEYCRGLEQMLLKTQA